jgi:hypothetical protein
VQREGVGTGVEGGEEKGITSSSAELAESLQ